MKRLAICVAAVLVGASALAGENLLQILKLSDGHGGYQEVVPVEGATAKELYSRAKAWVASSYKSSTDVLKLDDPAGGRLIVKGLFTLTVTTPFFPEDPKPKAVELTVRHTWTLEFKNARYRWILNEIDRQAEGYGVEMIDAFAKDADSAEIYTRFFAMIDSLRTAMKTPTPAQSDW